MHLFKVAWEAVFGGHKALQKVSELAAFMALVADIEPSILVEIGSAGGGTLWAWQQIGVPRIIGVDLPSKGYDRLESHDAEIVFGDSHDPATRVALEALLEGAPIDVLFIDGDHSYEGVKQDYEMYAPLVRPGGVVAFHDICDHPYHAWCQVRRFWLQVEGDTEEIITEPFHWGGIGVIRVPQMAEVAA